MRDLDKERKLMKRAGLSRDYATPLGEASAAPAGVGEIPATAAESLNRREARRFQQAGPAVAESDDEALAATVGGQSAAAEVEPRTTALPAKAHRSPTDGNPPPAATSRADDAVAELMRLGQEAVAHALAIRRGWAERAGNAKHKLTDAGHAALAGDEADRVSSRRRARNRHE